MELPGEVRRGGRGWGGRGEDGGWRLVVGWLRCGWFFRIVKNVGFEMVGLLARARTSLRAWIWRCILRYEVNSFMEYVYMLFMS